METALSIDCIKTFLGVFNLIFRKLRSHGAKVQSLDVSDFYVSVLSHAPLACLWGRQVTNSWSNKRDYAMHWNQYDEIFADILYDYFLSTECRLHLKSLSLENNKMGYFEGLKVNVFLNVTPILVIYFSNI